MTLETLADFKIYFLKLISLPHSLQFPGLLFFIEYSAIRNHSRSRSWSHEVTRKVKNKHIQALTFYPEKWPIAKIVMFL